jgi:hypothetical protein
MDYIIDERFSVREIVSQSGRNPALIRNFFLSIGMTFAAANSFALFACHGFHMPDGRATLPAHLIQFVQAVIHKEVEFLPMTLN